MTKVTKAVIPVAGLGTRMLPASKAIPKEMLTLADKPLIQYVVNECAAAGITEIILVTHSSKNAIENHFDTSFELESTLEARVKRQLLDEVRSITPRGVTIMHIRQGQAKGLGHAVLCAKPLVGDAPFVVVLPDVLIDDASADLEKENLAAMIREYETTGASQILVEAVAQQDVDKYGIVDISGAELKPGESAPISTIVEKPAVKEAPSNLAVVGRYVLPASIWEILEHTAPGAGDEIQLTDAIFTLMKQDAVNAFYMTGKSHDCGGKLGYMKAFVEYSMRHEKEGKAFSEWVKSL
ncbi:UTP--glucose-1-phosphate uridylyltransferase GalU [Thalassolituus alkanivorans]|uniref:UTP--glucose-1-phosphate uridylyltransferase GalU n=1 Tax=Thalassolituus alkanivorans TaxID=2881055 RepID=UPI001E44CA43|nr:UTP--glucose-1-phosphate uridylyltransferase GalU [Thalassolituus alkanivorans]MCB2385716.1 UTP--glucose-1-phosphate uridylyltransferase GalU [Thalassolituus alkanivorans]MCB2424096.1 UTP--glucose-1-phosphate uridylyltransferase GalU [Thalassolituus alkanivorans]